MSKLVPNIVDTARVFRGQPLCGKIREQRAHICLESKALVFEISKREPKARFFADKSMIEWAGGPWFIQSFKDFLLPQLSRLGALHLLVRVGDVEAKDLFSYRTCNVELEFNHSTLPNPIALQLVQKAQLLAIVDDVLERQLSTL